jgi:PAS domain S-box-containing protein
VHKILLIDDEEPVRKMVGLYLRSKGYDVITAPDGRTGIELFQKERPAIVLTDIKMPGMDGIEVLRRVKQINPETEVVVITGHGDINLSIQSLQLEASDFVLKPVGNEALSVALRRAEERLNTRRLLKEYTVNLEKKVEEATSQLRERYEFEENLIQHSIDGIVANDKDGRIIIFNRGAERIFGYCKDEVVGKMDIRRLYSSDVAEEIGEGLYGHLGRVEGTDGWRETFVVSKGGNRIPVRFSGSILYRDGETIGSVGFFHDLREIRQLQQELIRSERLAATGETVAGLAHCTKNVLIGLEGGVKTVDKGLVNDDMRKLNAGWDIVKRSIARISGLATDLLNYSKAGKPSYELCSPNAIALEVCELMHAKAMESRVEIVTNPDPTLGDASIDPKGVHRLLLNLVANAVDACRADPSDGKVHLVRVSTKLADDETLEFQVWDNGCGMNQAVKKQIFSSVFTTKGSRGTGLGLLVTQKIVKEQGGTISVKSEVGKGSSFTVRLPRVPSAFS